MSLLSLQTSKDDQAVRIALSGELDLQSVLTFEEALRRAERHGPRLIVLDLRRLKFMDSTGLGLILSANARAKKHGRRLRIVEGTAAVRRLFRLAGVSGRLELVDGHTAPASG